jgi:hypothetical protein
MDQMLERPTALFPTRISSRAIIAGTLVALAVDLAVMVLGGAIGSLGRPRFGGIGTGTEVGYIICHILALSAGAFLGAWTAAASARAAASRDAFLHALVVWAALIVVNVFILTGLYARSALYLVGGPVTVSKAAVVALLWGSFIAFALTLISAVAGALAARASERESREPMRHVAVTREPITTPPSPPLPSH